MKLPVVVKFLAVALLVYSFIAGMLVPLRPGIWQASPTSVRTSELLKLDVVGYNTHYETAKDGLRAWLKLDSTYTLAAESVRVVDETHLELNFMIPPYLPIGKRVESCALLLDNTMDGAMVMPDAVFITQDSIDPEQGMSIWKNSDITSLNRIGHVTFPFRNILEETIRNTYFHVALWFGMLFLLILAVARSIAFLRKGDTQNDIKAVAYTEVALLFGILGLATGAVWAKYTWGAYWSNDPKQVGTAIALLIYCAYFVLRASFEDEEIKARVGAVYSIFAFVAFLLLIYAYPRLVDSLHPGNGGNPAFGSDDLDNTMRMVFYPTIIGWILMGLWMSNLSMRMGALRQKMWDL